MLPHSVLQSGGSLVFDPGGLGALAQMASAIAPIWLILVVVVHVLIAWYIYCAAGRLSDEGHGPALFPPFLWGLASLVGVFVVPFAFAVIHYTTWFEPEEDVPWSSGGMRRRGGMMSGAKELHQQRVNELREELAAARGVHRRRTIRSELRGLEKEGPPMAPGNGHGADHVEDEPAESTGGD